MSPSPILLLGDDGQIGWELARRLPVLGPVEGVCYPDVDLRREEQVRELVRRLRPAVIVNAAAYTAVDLAESEPEVARAINADGPRILAEEAARIGALLVHYSTDFVYDGEKGAPYREDDSPSPLSVYGESKLAGDQAIAATGVAHLIFRTSWIYGTRGRNFLLTIRRVAAERGEVSIVDDQTGCPTWCAVPAQATVEVLKRVCGERADLDPSEVSGIYHLACGGSTTWCGFARAFLPREAKVHPITTAEYPTPARRPVYSVLDCGKLRDTFGIALPSWEQALADCLSSEATQV